MSISSTGVMLFGELILDVYVRLLANAEHGLASATSAEIDLKLGGNTWNISKTLELLNVNNLFICTSLKDDIPIGLQKSTINNLTVGVEFIPDVETPAPRFVAVDDGSTPILRAIQVPQQIPIKSEQKKFLTKLIKAKSTDGFQICVLASSIEPEMLTHVIKECVENKVLIIGAASSSPTVNRFLPNLGDIDLLVLNLDEAKRLADLLELDHQNDEQLAKELSRKVPSLIITRGSNSVIVCAEAGKQIYKNSTIDLGEKFVNDLGAGDAFLSFLIYAFQQTGKLINQTSIISAIAGALLACQTKSHLLANFNVEEFDNLKRKLEVIAYEYRK